MIDTTGENADVEGSEESRARAEREGEGEGPIPRDDRLGGSVQTGRPEGLDTPEGVDWRGWLLVALVVVSFVVVPATVLFLPEMHGLIGRLGFSRRQAYILFPMLPAIMLGLTAVWVAVRTYTE